MKISLKKYLLYSSVFAIFSEAFFFHFIIDWKLLYLIIIVNYSLLVKIHKIRINNYFILLIAALFLHGIVVNLFIGIPPNYLISQLLGIIVVSIYYYNFIPIYSKEEIIEVYTKLCLYAAIIGYFMHFLNILPYEARLHSIFKEPAHYVVVVIPACYYFWKTKKYTSFFIIFGSLILTKSSLGYIGCGLIFLLPNLTLKRIMYLTVLLPVLIGVFYLTYLNNPNVRLRVDDTYNSLNALNSGKFKEDTNVSTYALLSNLFVAKSNLSDHPFGSGLGSHFYMHTEVYSKKIKPPKYIKTLKLADINAPDANSMFLRILSDLGIPGILFLFFIMYKASRCYTVSNLFLAQGIFIYILLKLFRDGHYFAPELYFFIWLLYYYLTEKRVD